MKKSCDTSRNNAQTTRGRPFAPGNPGRPSGSRNKATVLAEKLMADDITAIATSVIEAAKNGDMTAARLVLERIVPVRKGRAVEFDLPTIACVADIMQALSSMLAATAAGELTPEEAQAIATLLETKRKAIETLQIEQRIEALEDAHGGTK